MKIGIIGTSSSISKQGYARALSRQEGATVVTNSSAGSSHAVLLPFMLERLEKQEIEYLIIDVTLNEQRAVFDGNYDLAASEDIMLSTLSWCHRRGVIPIILILPHMRPGEEKSEWVRDFYLDFCARRSIPFYDGVTFLARFSKERGIHRNYFFTDWLHINDDASSELAKSLLSALLAMKPLIKFKRRMAMVRPYRSIPVTSNKTFEGASRLLRARLTPIKPGDVVPVKVPPLSQIVGVAINASRSSATLKIGKKLKRLDSVLLGAPSLLLVVWAITSKIYSISGRVNLEAVASGSTHDFESSDHVDPEFLSRQQDNHMLEIVALIVRKLPRLRWCVATAGAPLDIISLDARTTQRPTA